MSVSNRFPQCKHRCLPNPGKHGHKVLQHIYPKCFLRKEESASLASSSTPSAVYSFSASLIAASVHAVSNISSYASMLMTTKSRYPFFVIKSGSQLAWQNPCSFCQINNLLQSAYHIEKE